MATAPSLETASVLAFERKIDPSDALFFAGDWNSRNTSRDWVPISVNTKSVLGTISNRRKATAKDQDPAKLDAEIENANPQTVDFTMLPREADTLKVAFTLRVLGGAGTPSSCNNSKYRSRLLDVVSGYAQAQGFNELAWRYACNLANGRFLWRNRIGAEQVEVHIAHLVDGRTAKTWTFDALALSLRNFDVPPNAETEGSMRELSHLVAEGLRGDRHVLLEVSAFVRSGKGQEVFPSQELILDRERTGGKSKTLYSVDGIAGFHSQKIGNALRTIDTWYPEAEKLGVGPIAAEPFGSSPSQGKAYRQPVEKADFYTLLDNWLINDRIPAVEQQHYVLSILIRGGVFGKSKD